MIWIINKTAVDMDNFRSAVWFTGTKDGKFLRLEFSYGDFITFSGKLADEVWTRLVMESRVHIVMDDGEMRWS